MLDYSAQIDTKAITKVNARLLDGLGERHINRFLHGAGKFMKGSVRKNFTKGGRPGKWAPLKASTLRRYFYPAKAAKKSDTSKWGKRKYRKYQQGVATRQGTPTNKRKARRRKPLIGPRGKGKMRQAINYKVKPDWGGTNDLVEIGVMGGLGRKWDPAKFLQRGTPKMAARPYVMFQQGDMAEVDDRAEDVVDKALGIGADTRSSTLREVMRTR